MSFMDAIQFPMSDSKWLNKLAIGAVMVIIPFLGWLVLAGYGVRIIRNIQSGNNQLPEWEDFGADLSRGFMVFIGGLAYYAPLILLACCNGVIKNNGLSCLLQLGQFAYQIAIMPVVASAIARFAVNEQLDVFFDFGGRLNDVTNHTNDAVMYVVNYFVLSIIGTIAIGIGLVLCCIPGLFAAAGFGFATYYLIAQWGKVIGVGGAAASGSMGGTPPTVQPLG